VEAVMLNPRPADLSLDELEAKCRKLRQMGISGHWAYSLADHVAYWLEWARKRELCQDGHAFAPNDEFGGRCRRCEAAP
jgi:hypothetical protein